MGVTPATVRIKPPNASWIVAGTEDQAGFVPEGISATSNQWGSDSFTCTIKRDQTVPWSDLAPFSPLELEVGGVVVWSGYCWQTPASGPYSIGVSARGWQYHLDDDQVLKFFVHAALNDWFDQGSVGNVTNYNGHWGGGGPRIGNGAISFIGNPNAAMTAGDRIGVTLDLGYQGGSNTRRISVDWASSNNDANTFFFARAHSDPNEVNSAFISDAFNFTLASGAGTTTSGTFVTGYRYVSLFLFANTTHALPAAGVWFKISGVRIYDSTAYESGGQSILKASDVIKAALPTAPLLDQGTGLITSTTFSIPMLAPQGYQTPRQFMQAANAFHDWMLQVNPQRQVVFQAMPTAPVVETNGLGGAVFTDAALNSGEDVYNKVITQAQGPDGSNVFSVQTATAPLLAAQGRTRTFVLSASNSLTQAAADTIGQAWLGTRARTPMKGSLQVTSPEAVRTTGDGQPIHPAMLLLYTSQVIRLSDRANPDDGGWGRHGTIDSVTYSHDQESASVNIDSSRDRLDALLQRLGVVESAAGLS